jgi:hypothetical protein
MLATYKLAPISTPGSYITIPQEKGGSPRKLLKNKISHGSPGGTKPLLQSNLLPTLSTVWINLTRRPKKRKEIVVPCLTVVEDPAMLNLVE